ALAVALRTAQVNIAEELHLDMLETIARAGGAAPVPGIETEGAQGVATLLCQRFGNETPAYLIEGADIGGRNGACGLADGTLVHHHHVGDLLQPDDVVVGAWCLRSPTEVLGCRTLQHVSPQCRPLRTAYVWPEHNTTARDAGVRCVR